MTFSICNFKRNQSFFWCNFSMEETANKSNWESLADDLANKEKLHRKEIYQSCLIILIGSIPIRQFLYSNILPSEFRDCIPYHLRSMLFLYLFYFCIYNFSKQSLQSVIFTLLTLCDKPLFIFTTFDDKTYESYKQHYLFISLFFTPVIASKLLSTQFSLRFAFLYFLLMVLSIIPLFSSSPTLIPLAISICALYRVFVHINPLNQYCWLKNILFTISHILIFLITEEVFIDRLQDFRERILDKLNVENREQLTNYPMQGLEHLSILFSRAKEDNPFLILGLFLAPLIYPLKTKNHYAVNFFFVALLSLIGKTYENQIDNDIFKNYFGQFCVFKIYLLMACGIYSTNIKTHNFVFYYLCLAIVSVIYVKDPDSFFPDISI
ncbi:hypothetical protein TRFO_35794 [Tritrichomonas foetus]|uniref:Uncharacterized protein n=1 Tax=Tritrichomonas foetus TaxID=1144522 RepID=A0A1J4JKX5_9EUKA|nr:hypothetical protein TRFO_35794 [Tritrichomonas foetus]|eukprot:OHS97916.1 hypothetical protein TRFO_35794 [Tritrichomonas foetus]